MNTKRANLLAALEGFAKGYYELSAALPPAHRVHRAARDAANWLGQWADGVRSSTATPAETVEALEILARQMVAGLALDD